jgi:hypothetical protein
MTTLSDIASPGAQGDFQELLNTLYGAAQRHMAKRGEFFPFAAAVGLDGEVELIAAVPNLHDDRPPSADVLDACHEALVSKKGALRAGGMVSDVRLLPPLAGDALRIDFEHMDGTAVVALLPYTQRPGSAIEYGDLSIIAGQRRIWV